VFLDRELERKAETKLSEGKNEEWERRKAALMGKRFDVVPMCKIKSHFVTIDSGVLYGIMRDISPEFSVSRENFTGENRETYWKNISNFKRLRVNKQKLFTGMIETDGVALCVHYRRLKKDRPVPPSAAPVTKGAEKKEADPETQEVEDNDFVVDVTKDEDEKEADPATQKVQDNDLVVDAAKDEDEKEADPATQEAEDNDFVVCADPGNTNIITIAAPKRAEDGTDGNVRQKDMRVLRISRARYYRESGIMNARKKIATWKQE